MALTPRFWALWATLLLVPLALFAVLYWIPSTDTLYVKPAFHFWVVSGTTLAAAVAYGIVIGLTRSLRETRLIFLGLAFMCIAGVFSVHGLLTPGEMFSEIDEIYPGLQISSWLSVLAGAFFIACSVVALPHAADEWLQRHGGLVLTTVALALGLFIGLSVATPDWLAWIPIENRTLQLATAACTGALLIFGAWRYFQAFLFARLPSQWAMVVVLL